MTNAARLACLALLALAACEREAQREPAAEPPREPSLVGAWASETPATFSGEGLRTEVTGGRTTYRPDRSFGYTGRLVIYGQQLPAGGIPFRIEAEGRWQKQGRALAEDFTKVQVTPEVANPDLQALAEQLGEEMAAAPPSRSDILEFSDTGLMLRDRETRKVSTYTRL